MSSFKLDKNIFNPQLYQTIRNVWFDGQPDDKPGPTLVTLKRWWMGSPEEKLVFDGVCRDHFAHALEAIGPDKFPNPSAKPFLEEVKAATQEHPEGDESAAAWRALNIIILLDQLSRNILRTQDGLRTIYAHYDVIAQDFVKTLLFDNSPIVRPDLHPQFRLSPAHRAWFYMPLEHSEDVELHKFMQKMLGELKDELEKKDDTDEGTMKYVMTNIDFHDRHTEILERFGRYPHRNGCLGREPTAEEKKYLEEGGETFGVSQK